ncbi:hypothetical protein [Streptomyces sp. NPDC002067]
MTELLAPPSDSGALAAPGRGRVLTPGGYTISAAAADLIADGTPHNTTRARDSRSGLYERWCRDHGRIGTDPGVLVDYAAYLAERQHPADTIAAYLSPLLHLRALSRHPVTADERDYLRRIISGRMAREATDPDGAGDALQVVECTRADLRAMLGTLDRDTVVGKRDACALTLAWYLGARASEVPALNWRDVSEEMAVYRDAATGGRVSRPGLVALIRRSKTNPHGKKTDPVRLLSQDDETCPVAAWRAWTVVLEAQGKAGCGRLLRRVRAGRITTAGRPPADSHTPPDAIADRTMRNLIKRTAAAAGLTPELTAAQRETLSALAERAELDAAADDAEREAIRVRRRLARRALRRALTRYAGQSMRRGQVRDQQRRRVPRHIIEKQLRYVPGSRALARYEVDLLPWEDNPTGPAAAAGHWL